MAEADELYTLRNLFFTGNFQEAIDEAATLKPRSEALQLERDVYALRSKVGLGRNSEVIASIRAGSSPALEAVKALAQYYAGPDSASAAAVAQVESLMANVDAAASPFVQQVAATLHLAEGALDKALRDVRSAATMEHIALAVQVHLRIDRPDLAEAGVRALMERDDESSVAALSAAAVHLALGGDRAREAAHLYRDVIERYGETVPLLNGLACAHIACRRFDDAERALNDALSRDAACPDTLVNLLSLAQHTGRAGADATAAHLATLRRVAPKHPYVVALGLAEGQFDRVAASFAVPA